MTKGGSARSRELWEKIHRRIAELSVGAVEEETGEELRDLWYRRALELSRVPDHGRAREDTRQVVVFLLGGDTYGVEITGIREIQRLTGLVPVVTAPDFIRGVMNLRGTILSVMDLRIFFGLEKGRYGTAARILVVESGGMRVGIVVDEVKEIAAVRLSELKPPLAQARGIGEDAVSGIIPLRGRMMMLIDLEKVLANPRLVVDETV